MNKKKSKALAFLLAASLLIPSANGIVSAAELDVNTDKVLEDSVVVDDSSLEVDEVVESDKAGKSWGSDYDTATTFTINSLEELKAFRDLVNTGKDFKGKTVNLNSNIDLNSEEWTPIGSGKRTDNILTGELFKGIFNGNGNTISNINITTNNNVSLIGLFGGIDGATIYNLKIENANIKSNSGNTGILVGVSAGKTKLSNIQIIGGSIKASNAGGIVGRMIKEGTIENCANSAKVESDSSSGAIAGIVAKAYYSEDGKEINIINCENSGEVSGVYAAGGIVGLSAAHVKNCTNTAKINTTGVYEKEGGSGSGGIVGEQTSYGSLYGNINTGDISGKNPVGGIVGWVRYNSNKEEYPIAEVITIANNKNTGNISALNGGLPCAGGIVGNIYNAGLVYNNENTAKSIVSDNFAAGIVGALQPSDGNVFYQKENGIKVYDNISKTLNGDINGACKELYVYHNDMANKYANLKNNVSEAVASSNGRNYASLEGAIQECENGKTVTLLKDVEIASPIEIKGRESIKIDFSGNEVKSLEGFSGNSLINIENSTGVSLCNGNFVINGDAEKAIVIKESTASMEGEFNANKGSDKIAVVEVSGNNSKLDISKITEINGKNNPQIGDNNDNKNDIILVGGANEENNIIEQENSTPSIPSKPIYTHEEIIGSDRYDTAAKIADKLGSYDNVVLVNAESTMSDGLSASGLAGKENGAILLTKKDSISKATMDRIKKVKKVYIIGGEAAISQKVSDEITKNVPNVKVERLGGKDRVETSEIVAKKLGNYSDAFVVNGFKGEADAMSASAIAAKKGAPILLTNGKTSTHAKKSGVEYYVIGGNSVVDKSIADKYNAEVLAGKDRYATNKEVINEFYSGSDKLYIANGDKLVDVLTASPLAKNYGIVLVNKKSDKSILKDKHTVQVGGMDFEIDFEK